MYLISLFNYRCIPQSKHTELPYYKTPQAPKQHTLLPSFLPHPDCTVTPVLYGIALKTLTFILLIEGGVFGFGGPLLRRQVVVPLVACHRCWAEHRSPTSCSRRTWPPPPALSLVPPVLLLQKPFLVFFSQYVMMLAVRAQRAS